MPARIPCNLTFAKVPTRACQPQLPRTHLAVQLLRAICHLQMVQRAHQVSSVLLLHVIMRHAPQLKVPALPLRPVLLAM